MPQSGRIFGYARVSTHNQTTDNQISELIKFGVPKKDIYQEEASGMKDDRPELSKLLKILQPGDTLVITKLDRIGRSTAFLLKITAYFEKKGVFFRSLRDPVDTSSPSGKLFLTLLAAFAEFERNLIVERVTLGLRAAKARGQRIGRPITFTEVMKLKAEQMLLSGVTVQQVAKELRVDRARIYSSLDVQAIREKVLRNEHIDAKVKERIAVLRSRYRSASVVKIERAEREEWIRLGREKQAEMDLGL